MQLDCATCVNHAVISIVALVLAWSGVQWQLDIRTSFVDAYKPVLRGIWLLIVFPVCLAVPRILIEEF